MAKELVFNIDLFAAAGESWLLAARVGFAAGHVIQELAAASVNVLVLEVLDQIFQIGSVFVNVHLVGALQAQGLRQLSQFFSLLQVLLFNALQHLVVFLLFFADSHGHSRLFFDHLPL